jgi:hypothetical protein
VLNICVERPGFSFASPGGRITPEATRAPQLPQKRWPGGTAALHSVQVIDAVGSGGAGARSEGAPTRVSLSSDSDSPQRVQRGVPIALAVLQRSQTRPTSMGRKNRRTWDRRPTDGAAIAVLAPGHVNRQDASGRQAPNKGASGLHGLQGVLAV